MRDALLGSNTVHVLRKLWYDLSTILNCKGIFKDWALSH